MSTGSGHHSYKGRDADEARGRLAWQSEASCVSVLSSLDWCSVFEEQHVLRAISQLTSCLSKPREVCLRTTMPRSMKVTQWYLTLCNPMDYSPTGSSVHGILQARILEWVTIPSSRCPDPGIEPRSPTLQADSLLSELHGRSLFLMIKNKWP